jgi:predicted RNA-binding protein with PUA-like domain
LLKSEPGAYSIEDLSRAPDQRDRWDGVRNYQARNLLRDELQQGDRVLFYHSGRKPCVVGTARVVRDGYPDFTAWDADSDHYDPRSTPENPVWFMVDIQLEKIFDRPVTLSELRRTKGLEKMMLLRRGIRLSVQPVAASEFKIVMDLAERAESHD